MIEHKFNKRHLKVSPIRIVNHFDGRCDVCGKLAKYPVYEDTGDFSFHNFSYKPKFNEYWCSECSNSIYDANSDFLED